jgi:formylglycine-generating enzyme
MERSDGSMDQRRIGEDMVPLPGGTFRMGSDKHYSEEAPVHRVTVDAFWIHRTPVTNHQFEEFLKATGHVTLTGIPPNSKDYPGALPHMFYAGSLVFSPPSRPVDLRDWGQWWTFLKGANLPIPMARRAISTVSTIILSCSVRRPAGLR